MEGGNILWLVIVIIGWIISAANKANKKQQEQAKKAAQQNRANPPVTPNRTQPVQTTPVRPAHVQEQRAPAAKHAAPVQPAQPTIRQDIHPTQPADFVSAHSAPLETHMHTPVMGEEGAGTEGIDCCHDYMLNDGSPAEAQDILSLADTDQTERAQALLQGVIFSEILGRRSVKRYGRRSA